MEIKVKTTKHDEILDITDKIAELIKNEETEEGMCFVFVKHTTCAITTSEYTNDVKQDFLDFLRKITPQINFRHDQKHSPDHLLSSLIGPSLSIPIKDGALDLGTWQRVFLVELSGPKERTISVTIIDE